MNKPTITRRGLLSALPLVAARPAGAQPVTGLRFAPSATVRVGIIGVGRRGMGLLDHFLGISGSRVTAICDVSAAQAREAQASAEKAGHTPRIYTAGPPDFENLCRRDDIDLVVVATPWSWHAPMAVFAMNQGKHVAVEVPLAVSIEDCWKLVDASERNRRHCIMLENCCYGYNELLVLNMVRDGKLGALTHGSGGYLHYLRPALATSPDREWMRAEYNRRNGNLYPTHGLAPIATYMGVNRGDRLASLVSLSSPGTTFRCGDQNTSLIRTANGLLITVEHNVTTPQPYDRVNMIAGTRGVFRDFPPRLYVDGETPEGEWEGLDRVKARYEHRLWKTMGEKSQVEDGHDGMDYIMCYRLIECMREGLLPDMDVYDGATWSAAGPLSELSVARGGAPLEFPDFTRGEWRLRPASPRDGQRS